MSQKNTDLSFFDRFCIHLQRFIGWITFPIWGTVVIGLLIFVGRYKIEEIQKIRREFRALKREFKGPILICANHMTKIDSALIIWALGSFWTYLFSFKNFSWNLPERERYANNPILLLICYLGSCIPIDRGGARGDVTKSMDQLKYILSCGYPVTIFPEGKRSRTGFVDATDFSYGIGQLMRSAGQKKVLCVYMRGHKQAEYSGIPKIGDSFHFEMQVFEPKSDFQGLRRTRDLAKKIVLKLKDMESKYLAAHR